MEWVGWVGKIRLHGPRNLAEVDQPNPTPIPARREGVFFLKKAWKEDGVMEMYITSILNYASNPTWLMLWFGLAGSIERLLFMLSGMKPCT